MISKRLAVGALAALGPLFFAAASAHAGMPIEGVAAVLEAAGLPVEIDRSEAEPALYSETSGLAFVVFGVNCSASDCEEYLFSASFETTAPVPLSVINEYNETALAGRAYLDDDGAVNLDHLFTVSNSEDSDHVKRNLGIWETILPDFAAYIGYYGDTTS